MMAQKSPEIVIMICNKIVIVISFRRTNTSWDIQRWFIKFQHFQIRLLPSSTKHIQQEGKVLFFDSILEKNSPWNMHYIYWRCKTTSRLPRLLVNSLLINFPNRNTQARYSKIHVPLIKISVITCIVVFAMWLELWLIFSYIVYIMHFGLQCSQQCHKNEVLGKQNKEFHIHSKWTAAQYTHFLETFLCGCSACLGLARLIKYFIES